MMLSRQAVAASPTYPLGLVLVVEGRTIAFEKIGPGIDFHAIGRLRDVAELATDKAALDFYRSEASGLVRQPGDLAIMARFVAEGTDWRGRDGERLIGVWPRVQDGGLTAFAQRAGARLDAYLSGLGGWGSFAEWGRLGASTDLNAPSREPQLPLTYHWLVGAASGSPSVHAVPVYDGDVGVFVRPQDGLLPVFSDELTAHLGALHYAQTAGTQLKEVAVQCLGCFLGGTSGVWGPQIVKGALLDDRWTIGYATCENEGPGKASHFRIEDGGKGYSLMGCLDQGTQPVWMADRWEASATSCIDHPWV